MRQAQMVRRGRAVVAAFVALAAVAAGTACVRDEPFDLRIMVPNAPGSGYDITARTAAKAIQDAGVVHGVEVFNLPGAGGSVGLPPRAYRNRDGHLLVPVVLRLA